jgi:surface protein
MSIRTLRDNTIGKRKISADIGLLNADAVNSWVRNPSWLAMPSVTSNEQKMVALFAVRPQSNYVAFLIGGGAYTVDWGDGVVENFSAGIQCNHEYSYSNSALDGTNAPVTLTDATDLVTLANHGYTNGMVVRFYNIVSTTGIADTTTYYVINATTDTFQVSSTAGGSAIALTTDGTATLLPYKQAPITVTMQSGQTLTELYLNVRHSKSGLQTHTVNYLDLIISGPSIKKMTIGSNSIGATSYAVRMNLLERVSILSSNLNNLASLFYSCPSLVKIEQLNFSTLQAQVHNSVSVSGYTLTLNNHGFGVGDTIAISEANGGATASITSLYYINNVTTNTFQISNMMFNGGSSDLGTGTVKLTRGITIQNMFYNCYSLQTLPSNFTTANCVGFNQAFYNAQSLKELPGLDTSFLWDGTSAFLYCYALQRVPSLKFPIAYYLSSSFSGCASLRSINATDMKYVTTLNSFVSGCASLVNLVLGGTTDKLKNISSITNLCARLQSLPVLNTSKVTDFNYAFSGCSSISYIPDYDYSFATNLSGTFQNCKALSRAPNLSTVTSALTTMSSMFSNCLSLKSIPTFNVSSVTTMGSAFWLCSSLVDAPDLNAPACTNVGSLFYSCSNLRVAPKITVSTTQSVDASSMFQNCSALKEVPVFNSVKVTNFSSAFSTCYSLREAPALNTVANTTFANMFTNCIALSDVPVYDTTAATTFASMFSNCYTLNVVPAINFGPAGVTSSSAYTSMFNNCSSLSRILGTNLKYTFSVAYAMLSGSELDAIYTNLPTVTSQTITVSSNYGTATDTPSIATAKGWGLTG